MQVNMNKTKVMISGERQKPMQKAARWPCGVCGRGVGSNSIQCASCHKWVHKKCSGIKGSMYKVMKSFICRGCSNPVTSTGRSSVDIIASANLAVVHKFCYLQTCCGPARSILTCRDRSSRYATSPRTFLVGAILKSKMASILPHYD